MCLSPITIVNPTKYLSLKYRDRFTLRVPCGQCAQCQQSKQREYYLRSFYHAEQCLNSNGFVLFDTLTYSDKYLPHISQYFPTKYNFSCFDSSHVRDFIKRLRTRCLRWYKSNFDFMLSSEYGTSEFHTHRPHYHILFFVTGDITPLQFSSLVALTWIYGRTDGKPYKSDYYVMNNILNGDSAKKIRVLKYVTKYISKSCSFTKNINKRVNAIMFDLAKMYPDGWLDSLPAQLFREKLMRHIGQFHRQSTGFGSSLLDSIDLNDLFNTGQVRVVDNEKVILSLPLPMYYKRKLFYDLVDVDGAKCWIPTDLGVEYLKSQQERLRNLLAFKYQAAAAQCKLKFDTVALSRYVVDYRGRIKADNPESTLIQRVNDVDFFKYATRYDRHQFGKLGLVTRYLGNSTVGYNTNIFPAHLPLIEFGLKNVYYNSYFEEILSKIDAVNIKINVGKQRAFELRQHLTNLYHYLSL